MHPTRKELEEFVHFKHAPLEKGGWAPRLRLRFGYYTPDEVYEAVVCGLVNRNSAWLDVGGGRDLFPSNLRAGRMLSNRCELLVGVDPSDNIQENTFVHRRVQANIEEFRSEVRFDLATLRMVAEHITDPESAVLSLSRLLKPGGKLVIYTVNRWAPITLVSWLVPFRLHHGIKKLIWDTEEKDTFPVAYKMNSRRQLRRLLEKAGFREYSFAYLDDCRTFGKWRLANTLELCFWKALHAFGLHYPETCLLGIYERVQESIYSR